VQPIRKRLWALALLWLVSQAAGIAAAPLVFACRGDVASESDLHECCRNLAPGQQCPMHHKPHDEPVPPAESEACAMRSACAPTDAAWLALAGTLGLPYTVLLPVTFDAAGSVRLVASATIRGTALPEPLPPRR
jgi:hypothetical protein